MSRLGPDGFDGRERAEREFAVGSVLGVRWWGLDGGLALAGQHAAQMGPWHPGENVAACGLGHGHEVPADECGCGFWAYWRVTDAPNPYSFTIPVLGVVRGYGPTTIGDLGFRCALARILALYLPGSVTVQTRAEDEARRMTAVTSFGRVRFRSDDAMATWRAICGRSADRPPSRPDPDEALARKAVVELELGDHYGVPVYASLALMLLDHPPTADYLPPEDRVVRLPGPRLTGAEVLAKVREMMDPPT